MHQRKATCPEMVSVSPFLRLRDCVIAGLRIAPDLWEFMPVWPALCDLGAPGWGEPWFPHSAVLLFLTCLLYGAFRSSRHTNPFFFLLLTSPVWRLTLCSLFFCFISRHTNLSDDAKPLSHNCGDGPFSPCCCFWFCFVLLCLFCLVCCCFFLLVWFCVVFIRHGDGLPGLCTGPPSARPLVAHLFKPRWMNSDATINANMLSCCMRI